MVSQSDLMDFLRDNPPANQFVPYCHLNEKSDCLTVYFEGDAEYSERLNDHVTLYRSLETKEVVGCRIKGVRDLLDDLPNYIRIKHSGIDLSLLFFAFRGNVEKKEHSEAINTLARSATEKKMVLEPSIY